NLIDTALAVAVQDGGADVVHRIIPRLRSSERDATTRQRMISALTRTHDPALAAEVRALVLDSRIRVNEVPMILHGMFAERFDSAAMWDWFKANFDGIAARTPVDNRGDLAGVGTFCTAPEREDYSAFFTPKIKDLVGGPRVFATSLEQINSCIALVDTQ